MFQRLRLRLEDRRYRRSQQKHEIWRLRQQQRKDTGRLRVYHEGFNARISGQPCKPPGYPSGADYYPDDEPLYAMRHEAWIEGWEAADKGAG